MRCNRVLQAVFVVAVRILSVASKALPNVLNATPTLFTYQGYVSDADKAHPVVVHVLVKAKLLQSGVYLMRAVLYTQKTRLESDEAFAPSLQEMKMVLEYQDVANNNVSEWSGLQFSLLGIYDPKVLFMRRNARERTFLLQPVVKRVHTETQGPYVLELKVPQEKAMRQLRLRLLDWPLYYSLDMRKIVKNNLSGKERITKGVFRNAIVMTHVVSADPNTAAKILATHIAHHVTLGFDLYLLYTWSFDLAEAISSNSVTSKFVDEGILQMVSMDALHFPSYDDNRADKSFPFHQSYDPRKLVIYNHAALTLWGELFHLAVLDVDEYFSAYPGNKPVNSWFRTCFPRTHVLVSSRVDAVCEKCALHGQKEVAYFSQRWNASQPTVILRDFNRIASFNSDPKSVFWPDKVGQVWLHQPFSLSGSKTVTTSSQEQLMGQAHRCVFVVHLYNLFKHRIAYDPRVHDHPVIAWVE